MSRPLLVVDSFGLIFRSYYAFLRPLTNPEGMNISAWFGFFKSVFAAASRYSPQAILFAMESRTPTQRKELYPEYKQNRQETPPDLIAQIPLIEETMASLGWPILQVDGWEADDCIATLAKICKEKSQKLFILSGDKDLMQLIEGPVTMLKPVTAGYQEIDREGVLKDKGVYPEQILDWLSLVGDSSDNIPGVSGIGEKTAQKLLSDFQTLEGVYGNLDSMTPSIKKKLEAGRDSALLSRNLAKLNEDLELNVSLNKLNLEVNNPDEAARIFRAQKAQSLLTDFRALTGYQTQGELFSSEPLPPPEAEGTYRELKDLKEIEGLLKEAVKAKRVALDTETTGLDAMRETALGISLCWKASEAYYIPLPQESDPQLLALLDDFLKTPGLELIGHNYNYDWKVLRRLGLHPPASWMDTMVAAWLIDVNQNSFGLEDISLQYLGLKGLSYKDIVPKNATLSDVDPLVVARYAGEDADFTFRLSQKLEASLQERGLSSLFFELEMPVLSVLAQMEWTGIRLEESELVSLGLELEKEAIMVEDRTYALVGHTFNLGSVKQLQEVLFEERKLKPTKKTKTGFSTDSETLEELALEDPVPEQILRYRLLTKLKGTYADALPKLINPETGRVHTHFLLTGTATGRLASKDPNLQNIPIKDEEGRKIRNAFTAQKGWTFISADYSQIELAVLAHFSGDPELSRAFRGGEDIHRRTASLVFHVPEPEVSPQQRRAAKAVNFGIIYGMSAFRLARELGIGRTEASEIILRYFESFPSIKNWIQSTVSKAVEDGFVTTLAGRQRAVPLLQSPNMNERQAGERMAVNTVIQGTAADIVKRAMLRVQDRLQKGNYKTRLLLQVHDELLLEAPEEESGTVVSLLKDEMEAAAALSLPLRVSVETAFRWGELH